MYTTGGGGGGGGVFFLGGSQKFFEGKRGGLKKSLKAGRGMLIFLDAIERLNICNIIDKPLHK